MTVKVVGELVGQTEGALDVHISILSPGSSEACRAVPCIRVRSFSARTASSSAAAPSPKSNSLVAARLGGAISTCSGSSGSRRTPELRSEEHTSELQSLMRISYAVFCLKKKNDKTTIIYKN